MVQTVRADVGPIILQVSQFGANPTLPAQTIYTTGKWTFTPGTVLTKLTGPRGATVTAVPHVGEQTIEIEWMGDAPGSVEAARLLGTATFGGATSANALEFLDAFAIGDGIKDRDGLTKALAAVGGGNLAGDVKPSVYEIRTTLTALDPTATGRLFRISPIPVEITDTTDVFSAALSAGDFASLWKAGDGTIGDTATVVFEVSSPRRGRVEIAWDEPQVPRTSILCMSGRETGNAFGYLTAENCVAEEGTYGFSRGAVDAIPTKFICLGATARLVQIDYNRSLASVPGIS